MFDHTRQAVPINSPTQNKGREQLIARVEEIQAVKEDGQKMLAAIRAMKLRTPASLRIGEKEGRAVHNINTL